LVATPPVARRSVAAAALAVFVVLTLTSNGYGFDRDELYFAMLHPAWGYVDQPPLVPLLAHALTHTVGGSGPWLLRIPASLFAAASVVVTALTARELGGDTRAQAWTAWGYAGTSAVLGFGHVLLTSSADLLFWPLVSLLVIRAELRRRPELWLVAGAVAGVATYNKLLIGWLLAGLALGYLLVGPRDRLRSPWVIGGSALALLLAVPNLAYQVVNGWPQLEMGQALADNNADFTRWFMWVFLIVILGPPLVVVWLAGLGELWNRAELRCFVVAFGLVVGLTFGAAAQPHYPAFLMPTLFAAGVVAMVERLDRGWLWRGLFALNAAVALVVSLPLLPVGVLAHTPIPGMNIVAADSVGWPAYVDQIGAVYDSLPASDRAVVVTSNYGEAGAVAHYRPDLPVYSGQNALYDQARPADDVTTVVFVGAQFEYAADLFASCEIRDRLDSGTDVDNEEQGEPVAVCRDPREPWSQTWPGLRHLD
jgi:4-amino-4-deoxy-L-arabinose transferase-like glycosyltransferase